jgi:hypothetical protein
VDALRARDRERRPARIHLDQADRTNGGAQNYGSAFLPAACQATRIGSEGQPIADSQVGNIKNPRLDDDAQRLQLDLVQSMNRDLLERERMDPGVEGVIESYELAFRMQGKLPGVMDIAGESAATKGLYGLDDPTTSVASACWRDASSRPGSASSNSPTATGTSTAA